VGAVRLVGQETTRVGRGDQLGRGHSVMALALGDAEGEWEPEGIDDEMNLRRQSAARATNRLNLGPPFPPAAC
jgi:hypothetical protein